MARPAARLALGLGRAPIRLWRRLAAMVRRARLGGREEPFASAYAYGVWGGIADQPYFSGTRSLPENVGTYVRVVSEYVRANAIRSVVDLGCGDVRASGALDLDGARYLGVDIVSSLIDHNRTHFGSDRVRFARLDFGREALPAADLCLIKQVLQHWSNADVLALLPPARRLRARPDPGRLAVGERHTGADPRHPDGRRSRVGGLYLEAPPFNWPVDVLHSYRSADGLEDFRLVRYRPAQRRAQAATR